MIRAGIAGATGYAGAELVRWLSQHKQVKLTLLTSRQFAGVAFADIFPAFRGVIDQVCEAYDADRMIPTHPKTAVPKKHLTHLTGLPALLFMFPTNTSNWSDTLDIIPANPGACARRLTTTMSSYR